MRRFWLFFIVSLATFSLGNAQVSLSFSKPGGCYADIFTLSINVESNENIPCQIYYTLNGGTPSVESVLYEHPIVLDKSQYSSSDIFKIPNAIGKYLSPIPSEIDRIIVVRAAAFNQDGQRCSEVISASYIISSLLGRTISLPVLSLCVDSVDFFDNKRGIFIPGASFDPLRPNESGNYYFSGREHEVAGHVELYWGDCLIAQDCGVRTHGNIGRRYAQKGLSLYARKEYGKKKFDPVFETTMFKSKHLILKPFRCAWTPLGFQDHLCQQMAKLFPSFESLFSRPVVLFINGEYWGVFFLEEKPDERYIQCHFGIEDKDVHIVRDWAGHDKNGDVDSSFTALMQWLQKANLTDEQQYKRIQQMIDIQSFTDYVLFETFIGNRDWPANNMRCWSANGSPWRFIFFDGDAIRTQSFEEVDNAMFAGNRQCWPSSPESTLLLRRLLQNSQYRAYFVGRLRQVSRMFSFRWGMPLRQYFNHTVSILKKEVPYQSKRFGFPKSTTEWRHAIRHQRWYWRRHCRKVKREWKRTIRKCNMDANSSLKNLTKSVEERKWARMEWICLDWNEPALKYYQNIEVFPIDVWSVMRQDESA